MDARNFIHNANSHTSLDVKICNVSIAKNMRVCNGEFKNRIEEFFWNFEREREREREYYNNNNNLLIMIVIRD